MADWNSIKMSAKRAARIAIKETGEAADIAGLRLKIKALEAKRNDEYELLGKLTYRQLKTGISQADRIAPVINNLDEIRSRIKSLTAEIEDVKKGRSDRRTKEMERARMMDEEEAELNEIVYEVNSDDDEDDDED